MINLYTHHEQLNWANACTLTAKLNMEYHLGFNDWVFPTLGQAQLLVLSDICEHTDKYYWTSSPYPGISDYIWIISFPNSVVRSCSRASRYYTHLVRASQLAEIGQLALENIGVATPAVPVVKYEHPHADLIFQWADLVAKGEVDKGWWEVSSTSEGKTMFTQTAKTNAPRWSTNTNYKIVKTDAHPDNAKVAVTVELDQADVTLLAGVHSGRSLMELPTTILNKLAQSAYLKQTETK